MVTNARKAIRLLATAALVFASHIASGQNLSPNPGFEQWTDGLPDDWIIFGVGPNGSCDDCLVSQDTNIFRSGASSLRAESIPGPFDFGFPGVVETVARFDDGDYDPDDILYGEVWVYDGEQDDFESENVFIEIKFVPEGCDGSDGCVEKHRPSISAGEIPDNQWVKLTVTSPPVDDSIESVQFAVFNFTNGPSRRPYTAWFDDALLVNLTECDLDGDGVCDEVAPDALEAGDADRDLDFDQLDLVKVQIAAKYLTGQQATWGEGDWDGAPGGTRDNPPAGNGRFDQLDIISALAPGHYLTGPYAAIKEGGTMGDEQTSLIYNAGTGELAVDSPASNDLTSINVTSAGSQFIGAKPAVLDGAFDNFAVDNIFKATFGGSFGDISFGNVLPVGLSQADVAADLSAVGSLAGGGDLGEVDLVYIPEPSTLLLLALASLVALVYRRRYLA